MATPTSALSLRWYQEKAVSEVLRLEDQVKRQLIIAATGAGKTIISSEIIRRKNKKTILIAHRDELIRQAADKLRKVWPDANVGIIKGKENEVHCEVISASVQSLVNRMDQIPGKVELLIIDECHHAVSPTYKRVIDYFVEKNPDLLIVGVTATPDRQDGKSLSTVFDQIIFEISMLQLIKEKYLVNVRGMKVNTGVDLSQIKVRYGDFDEQQLSRSYNTPTVNELVVETYINRGEDRLTVAFCCSVEHAKALAATFRENGVAAAAIDGSMKDEDRKAILNRFEKGELSVITNCNILTEGFDCPEVACILMVRPTQSRSLYVQAVGRGLRLAPQKNDCLVIDFVGNSTKHQLVTLTLILGTSTEIEKIRREKTVSAGQEDISGNAEEDTNEICAEDILYYQQIQQAYEEVLGEQFQKLEAIELLPYESDFDWNPLPVGYSINLGAGSVILVPNAEQELTGWDIWAFAHETESFTRKSLSPYPSLKEAQMAAERMVQKRATEPWMKKLVAKQSDEKMEPVSNEQIAQLQFYRMPIPGTYGEAAQLIDRLRLTAKLLEFKIIS